jgi:hypothetical protein
MRRCLLFLLFASTLCAGAARAQEFERGPDGGTTFHVSGVELLSIPGKPFSGKSNIEWTRTAEDGTKVVVLLQATLARDSQGRMYRERRSFVPLGSGERSRLNEVHLYDPVSRTQALCSARTFECVITDYSPVTTFTPSPAGSYANGTRLLERKSLGGDVMEGMNVMGTRETRTIKEGTAGNDRPLVSTREFWYSPELETNILVTRVDPREGKQVVRLSDLALGEPDPHMFDIPPGYTVRDERASVRRNR